MRRHSSRSADPRFLIWIKAAPAEIVAAPIVSGRQARVLGGL
jgi:hypothetical protein